MVPCRSAKVFCALSLAIAIGLAACSPYVYREEIAAFGSGVDTSVEAFTAMKPAYTAWATEQRDSELLAFARNGDKPLTEGCEDLEIRYEEAFAQAGAPAGDLLTPQDYAACQVVPVPDSDPDRGLPNLEGLVQTLKSSEERHVWKECVRTRRIRWGP